MTINISPGMIIKPGLYVGKPPPTTYYFSTSVITGTNGKPAGDIPKFTGSVKVNRDGSIDPGSLNVVCASNTYYNITNGSTVTPNDIITRSYVNSTTDYVIWINNNYNAQWEIILSNLNSLIIDNSSHGGGTYGIGTSRLGLVYDDGTPIVITITGADWSPANQIFTRSVGVSPPTWNSLSDPNTYITYNNDIWAIRNPSAFGDKNVYINSGTLTDPLIQWALDPLSGLGSTPPTGSYA